MNKTKSPLHLPHHKYRVWDGTDFYFCTIRDISQSYPLSVAKCVSDDLVFDQFTGQLDKDGKEVYENDIINNKNDIGVVTYVDSQWIIDPRIVLRKEWRYVGAMYFYEVIGNVHVNADLLAEKQMMEFKSNGRYDIVGRGVVYAVDNPRDTKSDDWSWIIDHKVRIDGKICLVKGVERQCIGGIYQKGRPIGLLVKELE